MPLRLGELLAVARLWRWRRLCSSVVLLMDVLERWRFGIT